MKVLSYEVMSLHPSLNDHFHLHLFSFKYNPYIISHIVKFAWLHKETINSLYDSSNAPRNNIPTWPLATSVLVVTNWLFN
jgi:hypothetical protein